MLFDLDCTLMDRPRTVSVMAERIIDRFGSDLDGATAETICTTIASIDANGYRPRPAFFGDLRRLLPWTRAPLAGALEEFWMDVFPACTQPTEGLSETLDALRRRDVKLGIVTNGRADVQARKIEVLAIREFFEAIIISGAVGVRKPDVQIFQIVLDALGVNAACSYFVGDHPEFDMLGARNAGITGVWVGGIHPWPSNQEPPPIEIRRLTDLLQWL